jgi:hypothetical protein
VSAIAGTDIPIAVVKDVKTNRPKFLDRTKDKLDIIDSLLTINFKILRFIELLFLDGREKYKFQLYPLLINTKKPNLIVSEFTKSDVLIIFRGHLASILYCPNRC